jgi:hypothetical protein
MIQVKLFEFSPKQEQMDEVRAHSITNDKHESIASLRLVFASEFLV